jgi:hypothetical protein
LIVEVILMTASKRRVKVPRSASPLKVKVKFLADCDPGGGKAVFKKGSVHELVVSSANHWITRRKAVRYVEPVKPAKSRGRPKTRKEAESIVEETTAEETPEEEPSEEEKKTEDGESFGEMDDLMA